MSDWDQYFIKMAQLISTKSKDPSTKVGCVIVGPDNEVRSTGYNGFPRGVRETVTGKDVTRTPVQIHADHPTRTVKVFCQETQEWVDMGPNFIDEIPTRRGNFDVMPDPRYIEDLILEKIMQHPYFSVIERGKVEVDPDRWERPMKYDYVEHAERNAIYNAARVGIPTAGCRAYLNWEPHPCKECTKAFIQAGIVEVIGPNKPFTTNNDWKFDVSRIMMDEAGVKITTVECKEDCNEN